MFMWGKQTNKAKRTPKKREKKERRTNKQKQQQIYKERKKNPPKKTITNTNTQVKPHIKQQNRIEQNFIKPMVTIR